MQLVKENSVAKYLWLDRKELILLNIFWIGIILYTVGFTLSTSKQFNFILLQIIQIIGCGMFLPAGISLMKFKFDSLYLKVLFVLYSSWLISVFLRGLPMEFDDVKSTIFDGWFGGFIYFVPFVLLFPRNLVYYKKVFDVAIILSVFFVFYDLMFLNFLMDPEKENIIGQTIIEYFARNLSVPLAFILLTYSYHKNPRIFFAIFVILLTLFFAVVRARRGLIFMVFLPGLLAYLLYFLSVKKKLVMTVISAILISIFAAYGTYLYHQNKEGVFSLIAERGLDDTRSEVEGHFFNDMEPLDWIIGKGADGEYYCPCPLVADENNHRGMVETDYLNIMMKGGIVSFGLLLMILIPAAIKGIFHSRNLLSKASGFWILWWLLNLYPATVFVFNLNHMIVWMAVGICYSKTIRNIPEGLMKFYFYSLGSNNRIDLSKIED